MNDKAYALLCLASSEVKLFCRRVSIRDKPAVQFLDGNSALDIASFSGWFVLVGARY